MTLKRTKLYLLLEDDENLSWKKHQIAIPRANN